MKTKFNLSASVTTSASSSPVSADPTPATSILPPAVRRALVTACHGARRFFDAVGMGLVFLALIPFVGILVVLAVMLGHYEEFAFDEIEPCETCSDPATGFKDGHPSGDACPRELVGDCAECLRVVRLNRFGWCVHDGTHHVHNRRPRPLKSRLALVSSGRGSQKVSGG